jgi:hypothetical protein
VRFVDFLKTTVLLSAGSATALATVTVLAGVGNTGTLLVPLSAGWWVLAALIGARLGRGTQASPAIARLLAGARASTALPEYRPASVLINRLWPLALCTLLAGVLAFLAPQIAAVGAGFGIIWALAWRRQHDAVVAIEERDGVRFYVRRTSPLQPIALDRVPGFKALRPEHVGGAAT